tara:strand:- start:41 stop:1141 length:1101 start_codon:yes stop_codon:yes gene_type:complete
VEIIEYDNLVKDYNESINNILRGFKPKFDFLEMWVPDSDHSKSILNLFDAGLMAGEDKISLLINSKSLEKIDYQMIKEEVQKMGTLNIRAHKKGELFEISYGENEYQSENRQKSKVSLEGYSAIYKEKLISLIKEPQYEGSVQEVNDGGILVRSNHEGMSLFAEVDPEKAIIRNISFAGVTNDVYRGLLEGLCQIIDRLPIQEASEHGVIKLEYMIRDQKMEKPVPGLITPFNMPEEFQVVNKLLKSLFQTFCDKTKYQRKNNYYDSKINNDWKIKNDEERKEALVNCLNDFNKKKNQKYKINLSDFKKGIKAFLSISGDILQNQKPPLLREVEEYLQINLEKKIEVYHEEYQDLNKKRIIGRFKK